MDDLIVKRSWFETTIVGEMVTSVADKAYYGGGMSIVMIGSKLAGWERPSEEMASFSDAILVIAEAASETADGARDILCDILTDIALVWFGTLSAEDRRWVLKKLELDPASITATAAEIYINHRVKSALKKWMRRSVANAVDSVFLDVVSIGKALRTHGFSKGNLKALGQILGSKVEKQGPVRIAGSAARVFVKAGEAAAALQALAAESIIGAANLTKKYPHVWKLLSKLPPVGSGKTKVLISDWKYLFFFIEKPLTRILEYTEAFHRKQSKGFYLA